MENKKKWFLMMLMFLVFGLTIVGCDSDIPDNGNNDAAHSENTLAK